MSRTITNNDLKNKRDLSAWRIELNGYDMSETNAKHESAVKELAEREEKRIGILKDTLWKAAVPFFGINITPEKLKEKFESIMNAECNMDARTRNVLPNLKRVTPNLSKHLKKQRARLKRNPKNRLFRIVKALAMNPPILIMLTV